MFLLQLTLAFQDIVGVADSFPEYFLESSEWLAGMKGTREIREIDGLMQFTPGCIIMDNPDYGIPTCGVWYGLLIGERSLRDDPEFTVRTLEQCLLALSGSVFLLIIRYCWC